jgi:hypothetical protein
MRMPPLSVPHLWFDLVIPQSPIRWTRNATLHGFIAERAQDFERMRLEDRYAAVLVEGLHVFSSWSK